MLHSTLGQCEEISDCSYTGQTFLQKRNINNVSETDEKITRLLADISNLQNNSPAGVAVSGSPRGAGGDILTLRCYIDGLPDSFTEDGMFKLTLTFPPDYPFQPPEVKFRSEMFHPNISPDGRVPLTNWSPAHDVTKILTDIQSLLSQPHLDSPVNQEAAQLYREDRAVNQSIENSCNDEEELDIDLTSDF